MLYKAQEEADPLVNVPKDSAKNSVSVTAVDSGESSSSSRGLVTDSEPDHSLRNKEKEGEQGNTEGFLSFLIANDWCFSSVLMDLFV